MKINFSNKLVVYTSFNFLYKTVPMALVDSPAIPAGLEEIVIPLKMPS